MWAEKKTEKRIKRQDKPQVEFAFNSTQAMKKAKTAKLRIISIVTYSCKTYLLLKT